MVIIFKLTRRTHWTTNHTLWNKLLKLRARFRIKKKHKKPSAGGVWNIKSLRKSFCVKPIGNKNRETWMNSMK